MLFPGPKLNTLFASRWKALAWAGGVLLTAYCSIPSREESEQADPAAHASAAITSTSPWAPDPKPAAPAP
ncbi:hypothetical protein [Novosphingobium sp.]|uniref:hypothetical protein n=1 Tax=Novosphingobium sp. TaxID=1874826 RepID=UPI003B51E13B